MSKGTKAPRVSSDLGEYRRLVVALIEAEMDKCEHEELGGDEKAQRQWRTAGRLALIRLKKKLLGEA